MSSYLRPLYSALTDSGRRRDHNEDALHAGQFAANPDWYLFAVADGVGGHQRGEWASQTAISVLLREVPRALVGDRGSEALRAAFLNANVAIWDEESKQRPGLRAATTLVAALLTQGMVWWANVGDSRAYLVRQGHAARLSQDHSWVEEQVRAGIMSREEAAISERRNVITRSIGGAAEVDVDLGGPVPLRSGDALVLCSDGLHGQVGDDELAGIVQQLLPEPAAERLVALANERGGPDNISVVVCGMYDASATAPR